MTRPHDPAEPVPVQPAFDELGRLSFAEHSLQSVVQRVTELATRVLPGEPATSVTVVTEGKPATVAASGRLSADLDRTQYRLGGGPCIDAAVGGRLVEVVDTSRETRWPEFARAAAAKGCASMLSFPLPVQELVRGALNVYARRSHASDARTRELASRFAEYAVVPVSNMYLYVSAVERAEHLQAALDSRAAIDQAKGMLMERYKLTADQAFRALARVSMDTNTKVRDVAVRFVETGELEDR